MRLLSVLVGLALLGGCASPANSLICPEGNIRFGERTQVEVYLTGGDIHGNSLAVALPCPGQKLPLEARMVTVDERRAFWDELNSFEPSRGVIPTGRATVVGKIRQSPDDGLATLEIYQVKELEPAFPPPEIAATLGLPLAEARP
jgi:hypothetical protein